MPANFPLPVLCVQHISMGFLSSLVQWLDESSPLKVRVAVAGEFPEAGRVYFPAEDTHLVIGKSGRLKLLTEAPLGGHRPSVDLLFKSVAQYWGKSAVAVLLSGMGSDGASGMADIASAGGQTIAQDEATSVVFGMPKEAIELGAVRHVLPIDEIGPSLIRLAAKPD